MLKLTNFCVLLFLYIIKKNISHNLTNNCFKILDGSEDFVNIMFDSQLHFVPEVMRVTIKILDSKKQSEETMVEKSQFLRKQQHSCQKPLIVKIPNDIYDAEKILIELSYGRVEKFKIDEFHIIIRRLFREVSIVVHGLLEYSKMEVIVTHDSEIEKTPSMPEEILDSTLWKDDIADLESGELYCLDFFTFEFDETVFLSPQKLNLPFKSRFYILTVRFFIGYDHIWYKKEYFVKANHCRVLEAVSQRLDIFTDPKTTEIQLIFKDGYSQHHVVKLYKHQRKNLYTIHYINYCGFRVIKSVLNQKIVNQKLGLLLYNFEKFTLYRWIIISGIKTPIKFQKIVEEKVGDVVLRRKSYLVDMSRKKEGVFPIVLIN